MDLSSPHSVLLTKTTGAVLSVLAGTSRPLSGREVARVSGGKHSTVALSLQRLVEHGLVLVQEAGSGAAFLYSLNRNHLAIDAVLVLTSLRRRLTERLKAEIERWDCPALHASLFGSAARGDGGTESDIDLFIIRRKEVGPESEPWRSQLERLPTLVLNWTGNRAGISEISEADIGRLSEERPPVLEELLRDTVLIVGPPVHRIFGGSPQ